MDTRLRLAATLTLVAGATTFAPPCLAQGTPPSASRVTRPIHVAYPPSGHRLSHHHVLLEGSVWPGGSLRVNGQPIAVGSDGLFILWWPLDMGNNRLTLETVRGNQRSRQSLSVYRTPPRMQQAAYQRIQPRPVQVRTASAQAGLNTARDAWENDQGQPVLYAQRGMQAVQIGRKGDLAHMRLANGQQLWASANTLGAARATRQAFVGRPRVVSYGPRSLEVRLPVSARVPVAVEEGGQQISVHLIGAQGTAAGQLPPQLALQQRGATATLTATLPRPLHGYTAAYEAGELGDELVLRAKVAPEAGPLTGRRIVLDAGHGGAENGGAGPLRVPEKDIVLPITLRAAELLRQRGAEVILPRTDDRTVPIYTRPKLAANMNADVLVSVHANAIPDGVDPRTRRGTSVFYTHPFARPLASTLFQQLRAELPEVGGDGLRAGANLALTRPTTQPSVLLELGYLTDAGNLRLLMSAEGQERFAQAIAGGLERYFAELPE